MTNDEAGELETLLTTNEVAAMLQLEPCTIRKWKSQRTGPTFIKLGAAVRYRLGDVEAWIESNARAAITESSALDMLWDLDAGRPRGKKP